jgi:hypothetical protein
MTLAKLMFTLAAEAALAGDPSAPARVDEALQLTARGGSASGREPGRASCDTRNGLHAVDAFKAAAPPVFTPRYSATATGLQDLGYPSASEADLRGTSLIGHLLTVDLTGRTTGSDWLPTFEFGLANDSSCL